MEKSTSIVNLARGLKAFHASLGKITKEATNPFFNSKYATLSAILEAIKQPLQDAGLSFTQFPTGQNGLTSVLMHCESGEFMQCEYFMQPIKNDPQAQGSVISYMRRYSLAAILGLNLDEDDDANRATHGAATPKEAAAKAVVADKPWLDMNSKKYDLVVERLKAKTTTLSHVAQFFKLNKEVRAELQSIVNEAAGSQDTTPPAKPTQQQPLDGDVKILPALTTTSKKYDLVVERLRNRTTTVAQVKTFFTLSKEMEEVLLTIERTAQLPVEQEPA
jgi:hypothetical protein